METRRPYNAVKARGYRDGWTAEQFAARQVVKLQEELGELSTWFNLPFVMNCIHDAGGAAAYIFDDKETWEALAMQTAVEPALEEIADMLIVIDCLIAGLEEITGEEIDMQKIVEKKAFADIERGVR